MGRLDGQVALVTGGSRGIGRAIALRLAREGARVAVNYHASAEAAKEVAEQIEAEGGQCLLVQADVGDRAVARGLIGRVVDVWGRLDVLVNNAGITRDRTLRKLTDDDWSAVLRTNLDSVFACTTAAVPVMVAQGRGRIVNVSSFVGQAGNFGQANYAASKAGVIGFSKTAALEVARAGVTVNVVAPGFTSTDMLAQVPETVQAQLKARIPLGRFAEPDEVAKAVLFLVADGDYITGQQINVNGGISM